MKILIIQDFLPVGRQEANVLTAAGHEVTLVVGIKDVENLVGWFPDKTSKPLDTDYDVAIVDGQFYGPSGKLEDLGAPVVERLVKAGVKCIANSSKDPFNTKMVEAGAFRASNQLVLYVLLVVAKLVTGDDLVTPSADTQALIEMDAMKFIQGPGKDYREAADKALMDDAA